MKRTGIFSITKKSRKSSFISLVSLFAAFNVICDLLLSSPMLPSGVWFSWIFIVTPISGILLGPYAGFLSSLIGVMVGHSIVFRGSEEFLFTLGAPLGAMISGLLFRGRSWEVLIYYLAMFGAFFASPVAWQLPLWCMWDTFLALGLLLSIVVLMQKWRGAWDTREEAKLLYILALCAIIGLEADVLYRIMVLVPGQAYQLIFEWDLTALQGVFLYGAGETPIKVALATLVTIIIGPPILLAVRKAGLLSTGNSLLEKASQRLH